MLTKKFKNQETKAFVYNLIYHNGYEKYVEDSSEVYRNVHKIKNLKSSYSWHQESENIGQKSILL